MRNQSLFVFLISSIVVLLSSLLSAQEDITVTRSSSTCCSQNGASTGSSLQMDNGGKWSRCETKIQGPDLMCYQDQKTFKANLPDDRGGCEDSEKKVKWKTSFSEHRVSTGGKEGNKFTLGVTTKHEVTGTVTATHPCCGKAEKTVTLNGPLRTPQETAKLNFPPEISPKQFEEDLSRVLDRNVKISDRKVGEIVNKIDNFVSEFFPDYHIGPFQFGSKPLAMQVLTALAFSKIRTKVIEQFNQKVSKVKSKLSTNVAKKLSDLEDVRYRVTATYRYRECGCDPARPGGVAWGWTKRTGTAKGTKKASDRRSVEIDTSVSLEPFGVGVDINITAQVRYSLAVKNIRVNDKRIEIDPKNRPKPPGGGTNLALVPEAETEATASVKAGASVIVGTGGTQTTSHDLKEAEGAISHDCEQE